MMIIKTGQPMIYWQKELLRNATSNVDSLTTVAVEIL